VEVELSTDKPLLGQIQIS